MQRKTIADCSSEGRSPAPLFFFQNQNTMKLTEHKTKRQELEERALELYKKEMAGGAMKTQAIQNIAEKLHLGWWQVQYIIRKQATAQQ
jgi:hypothetical protein